ncbi:MAG: alpha/beta hydrolase [Nodosilinea sp.]
MPSFKHLLVGTLASTLGLTGLALEATLRQPETACSADAFTIRATGPLVFTLSVDSLETFAETGEVAGNLKLFARFLSDEALARLQLMLQFQFPIDVVTASNLSYSPLGRDAITNVGKIFQSTRGENGFYALRAAVISAAAKAGPDGLTLIDVMREFPADAIDVNVGGLLDLQRELSIYLSYNRAAVQAIRDQAAAEAATQTIDLSALPNLSPPGPYSSSETTITVTDPSLRQPSQGLTVNYDFDVDVYLPQDQPGPAPVVIVSHGFGAVKSDLIFATGSHFLTTAANVPNVNPALSLEGIKIGVLANSTNESFLQERHPAAAITRFDGPTGRVDAIRAVNAGQLDAFLGDDILTRAAVTQSGLSAQNLTLVPELPLSCEYYSLALPNNDPQWVATVNGFLETKARADTHQTWLGTLTPDSLSTLTYCLNR